MGWPIVWLASWQCVAKHRFFRRGFGTPRSGWLSRQAPHRPGGSIHRHWRAAQLPRVGGRCGFCLPFLRCGVFSPTVAAGRRVLVSECRLCDLRCKPCRPRTVVRGFLATVQPFEAVAPLVERRSVWQTCAAIEPAENRKRSLCTKFATCRTRLPLGLAEVFLFVLLICSSDLGTTRYQLNCMCLT